MLVQEMDFCPRTPALTQTISILDFQELFEGVIILESCGKLPETETPAASGPAGFYLHGGSSSSTVLPTITLPQQKQRGQV